MAEKKEYRSAVRSRRLINQAFLELLREKPFEKITVTDIVKRADINRSTFYAHYPDVRGLVEVLLENTVSRSLSLIEEVNLQDMFTDPRPFLRSLLDIGMENMELYRVLGCSDFALRQVEQMKVTFLQTAVNAISIPERIRRSSSFQVQINFFIGGILNTFQQWIQGNLNCSTEEIMEQIAGLIRSNADTYRNWLE